MELLKAAGHARIVFENIAPSGDPSLAWLGYPIGNRDDSGSGITRELALARLWRQVTGV